jgi:hypothetical protein
VTDDSTEFAHIALHSTSPSRSNREADLCWRELAIVAKALVDGRDVTEIGLMRDVALRTIAVFRDAGRM